MDHPFERARFDSPELDLDRFAGRFGRVTANEPDPEVEPFLNVLVHLDAARSAARSGLTSTMKRAQLSKTRSALLRALEVIDAARERNDSVS